VGKNVLQDLRKAHCHLPLGNERQRKIVSPDYFHEQGGFMGRFVGRMAVWFPVSDIFMFHPIFEIPWQTINQFVH
jgi:hypothetical protein